MISIEIRQPKTISEALLMTGPSLSVILLFVLILFRVLGYL